jgi:hypothetical protein
LIVDIEKRGATMELENTGTEGQHDQTTDNNAATEQAPLETSENQNDVSPIEGGADADAEPDKEGDKPQTYLPFQGGKEKFKINGKELEWDWPTVQRYAQKGYAGMQALQRAAETEKKAKQFFGGLQESAARDPEGVIRILLGDPNWRFQAQRAASETHLPDESSFDPKDRVIQELQAKVEKLSGKYEQTEIEQERAAIAKEISDAENRYPNLKGDEVALEYVKSQYRKALSQGLDVTIDDVAFEVNQKLEERKLQRAQQTKKRIEEKRKTAPVTHVAGAPAAKEKGFDTFDDVRDAIKSGKL